MDLKPSDCMHYYCNQVGGGGPYFQGVLHQRGYGLFGDIFRKISPFIYKAGKYLGRNLLHTGSNIISDVAEGKQFKTAAKQRFVETGENMKDDVIHKLQTGSGIKRKRTTNSVKSIQKKRRVTKGRKDIFS